MSQVTATPALFIFGVNRGIIQSRNCRNPLIHKGLRLFF